MTFMDPQALRGRTLVDRDGEEIGEIKDVYLKESTDDPEFALVSTGSLGRKSSLVPLEGAEASGEQVRAPFGKDRMADAPDVEGGVKLSPSEERAIYQHYGVGSPTGSASEEGGDPGYSDADPDAGERRI